MTRAETTDKRWTGLARLAGRRAADTDRTGDIGSEVAEELRGSGLFATMVPERHGGSALGLATLLDLAEDVGAACGSTGWIASNITSHAWLVALFPDRGQREVWEDPRSGVASVFRMQGEAERHGEEVIIRSAEGRFCSGVDVADWIVIGLPVSDAHGSEQQFLLVHRSEVTTRDDWHVMGLRGTGSRSIDLREVRVPARRVLASADVASGSSPGGATSPSALHRLPFPAVAPFGIAGPVVGIAQAAVGAAKHALKLNGDADTVGPALDAFGAAAARIAGARALLRSHADQIDQLTPSERLQPAQVAMVSRDIAFAVQEMRTAVEELFHVAGGSSVHVSSALQRCWRDISAAAQHVAFSRAAFARWSRSQIG